MLKPPYGGDAHGVVVPCAGCGKPIHIPRIEVEMVWDIRKIACSTTCGGRVTEGES